MEELKPCPFCGHKSLIIRMHKGRKFINGLDHPIEQHKWYVQCCKCKARGSIASGKVNLYENYFISQETRNHFPMWQTIDDEIKRIAVKLWNYRID